MIVKIRNKTGYTFRRIFVFIALFGIVFSVYARNVSVSVVNADASEVFIKVVRQAGKNYLYPSSLLKGRKITVRADNKPLHQVLGMMFDDTDIEYSIKGDNVILRQRRHGERQKPNPKPKRYVTVSGFVREAQTGEALVGAVVTDTVSRSGTQTNAQGFYSLKLPEGGAGLKASCFDYISGPSVDLSLTADCRQDFFLDKSRELEEVVVIGSRDRLLALDSPEVGRLSLGQTRIKSTPVIFGESDVTKTLQLEPGVASGVEGLAGMTVHGGNADENLYMLDNVPLYQVNHFAGLFSAFNTGAIRSAEFYKMSFPAKYDGRLSSYLDVSTLDGGLEQHHGSFQLGLTSGALNVNGPIVKGRTSYSVSLRRSWYDIITIPAVAIINLADSDNPDEKIDFRYAFTDLNAKINHHFSDRSSAFVSAYYGEDFINTGSKLDQDPDQPISIWNSDDKTKMHWGNVVASAGWRYVVSPTMFAEFTGAFSRYFSRLSQDWNDMFYRGGVLMEREREYVLSVNSINDWILRADFTWHPGQSHKVGIGAGVTFHEFLPSRMVHRLEKGDLSSEVVDATPVYHAVEANAYIGDTWNVSPFLTFQGGLHMSLFNIDGKVHYGVSPRFSASWNPVGNVAVKAAYSRTTQYVHQLSQSYLSLPTDQWVPVMGSFKPQHADKVAVGGYWTIADRYVVSVEGWWKWMRNLIDYRDEYYLLPPQTAWNDRLVSGQGTAKGIDVKIIREAGRITGHISYSLMWADRTFAGRNGGRPYPARNDNRHKINVLLAWHINDKWEINAAWTGMTGNRYTLPTEVWTGPGSTDTHYTHYYSDGVPLDPGINNCRLPFYHRLDLGVVRYTRNGNWTFSLFNAYCNMNVIALSLGNRGGRPVFQKVRLLPIIPSVSYTWNF